MEHLRADYTEVWVASPNVPLIRFADRVRSISSTGLDLVGITEPPMAELSEFDSIVSWYEPAGRSSARRSRISRSNSTVRCRMAGFTLSIFICVRLGERPGLCRDYGARAGRRDS